VLCKNDHVAVAKPLGESKVTLESRKKTRHDEATKSSRDVSSSLSPAAIASRPQLKDRGKSAPLVPQTSKPKQEKHSKHASKSSRASARPKQDVDTPPLTPTSPLSPVQNQQEELSQNGSASRPHALTEPSRASAAIVSTNTVQMPSSSSDLWESWLASLDNIMPDFDNIEKHFKAVANSLLEYPIAASIRETIQSSPWLYKKPAPPPPPRQTVPIKYIAACKHWVSEHRAVSAAIIAFLETGAIIIWRQRRADRTKRRPKRAKNGARTEVAVLAGSPLTRSLSLDLERRGFIVYILVSSLFEEQLVQSGFRADIRPLHLDVTSVRPTLLLRTSSY
jgi:hypothetical protein